MKKALFLIPVFLCQIQAAAAQEIFDLIRKGDASAVKALIEKSPEVVRTRLADGATPLHVASMNNRGEIVSLLLDKKPDLEARNDYGRTPLILCARELGQAETGRLLIDAGADVNAADKFGSTALELAAWRGKADFVDLLLAKGAKVPESGRQFALLLSLSASQGFPALFKKLAGEEEALKASVSRDPGLLHSAAAGGSAEIIAALIDIGLDPKAPDRFGWTPLHYAARDGRTEAVRTLLERGAALEAR